MAKFLIIGRRAVVKADADDVADLAYFFCRGTAVYKVALSVGVKSYRAPVCLDKARDGEKCGQVFRRFAETAKDEFLRKVFSVFTCSIISSAVGV